MTQILCLKNHLTYALTRNHWKFFSCFSSRTMVSAELNLHISTGSFPTAAHIASTSLPRPQRRAVSILLGSMNGARDGQTPCATSKRMSVPTLTMPLISRSHFRILEGDESTFLRKLLRSLSVLVKQFNYRLCKGEPAFKYNAPYFSSVKSANSPKAVAVFSRYLV